MDVKDLVSRLNLKPSYNPDLASKAVKLYRDRAKSLNEIKENIAFFFLMPEIRIELFDQYITTEAVALAEKCLTELNRGSWSEESINNELKTFVKNEKIKFPIIAMPLRVILAGTDQTPSVGSLMAILGKQEVNSRLQSFKNKYDY